MENHGLNSSCLHFVAPPKRTSRLKAHLKLQVEAQLTARWACRAGSPKGHPTRHALVVGLRSSRAVCNPTAAAHQASCAASSVSSAAVVPPWCHPAYASAARALSRPRHLDGSSSQSRHSCSEALTHEKEEDFSGAQGDEGPTSEESLEDFVGTAVCGRLSGFCLAPVGSAMRCTA